MAKCSVKKVEVPEDDVPEKIDIFSIAKNIMSETEPLEWDSIKETYNQYMINKIISQYNDTLFMVAEINRFGTMDDEMHYRFLFHIIDKRKRYVPWERVDTQLDEKIKLIKESLGYSTLKCREIIPIIDSLDLWSDIEASLDKGGASQKKIRKKTLDMVNI